MFSRFRKGAADDVAASEEAAPAGFNTAVFDVPEQVEDVLDEGIDTKKMTRKERKALEKALSGSMDSYPHLLGIKPHEGYAFYSDYFTIDGRHATILSFFHKDGAVDSFRAFWGINRTPVSLMGDDVSIVTFEQVGRLPDSWVTKKIAASDRLDKLSEQEQAAGGTNSSRREVMKVSLDAAMVAGEIQDGASYLRVTNRMLIHTRTLEQLDQVVESIRQWYIDKLPTITPAPYAGEQYHELQSLFNFNNMKRGKGEYFTSVEFAGSYSLVTNGLNDPSGEYVGQMIGDVNSSAVLFDVNNFDNHVVLGDGAISEWRGSRFRQVDLWGSKLSQAALMDNARVVHVVLNDANLDKMGPKFDRITARVDLTQGDVNMFEVFGDTEDELQLFPTHLEKIVLMAIQAYGGEVENEAILRGKLKDILNDFYVDQNMWAHDAKNHRDRLRLVGIPHDQVPLLFKFMTYLDTAYSSVKHDAARDQSELVAVNSLRFIFQDLLANNGDLFNNPTSSRLDGVHDARRIIYNFAELMSRGKGIAMAQLVNIIGFAVSKLGSGDLLIIHGADYIDAGVKEYMEQQLSRMLDRGGRVAYLYNDVEKVVADRKFNEFVKADYTILGGMSVPGVQEYEEALGQRIPGELGQLIASPKLGLSYLRRGVTNIVFRPDLILFYEDEEVDTNASMAKIGDARRGAVSRRKGRKSRRGAGTQRAHDEVDRMQRDAAQRKRNAHDVNLRAKRKEELAASEAVLRGDASVKQAEALHN